MLGSRWSETVSVADADRKGPGEPAAKPVTTRDVGIQQQHSP
jgi:hypothetical protein